MGTVFGAHGSCDASDHTARPRPWTILAATAAALLCIGLAVPASAAPVLHSPAISHALKYPYDGKTCFEGPLHKDHTKPGGTCWAGGLCLKPGSHFILGDNGIWCMGSGHYVFKHPRLSRHVVGLNNSATVGRNYYVVDLVGYVTHDPGNPIPGHSEWPFRDPNLDHIFAGYPVIDIIYAPDIHKRGAPPPRCIQDLSLAENLPASYGPCSKPGQFARDTHASFFVWLAPEHRIDAVHLANASGGAHSQLWCLFADDPGLNGEPWYVRLRQPQGPVHLVGVFQYWYERHISVPKGD
jgi:hypothetical protein